MVRRAQTKRCILLVVWIGAYNTEVLLRWVQIGVNYGLFAKHLAFRLVSCK